MIRTTLTTAEISFSVGIHENIEIIPEIVCNTTEKQIRICLIFISSLFVLPEGVP